MGSPELRRTGILASVFSRHSTFPARCKNFRVWGLWWPYSKKTLLTSTQFEWNWPSIAFHLIYILPQFKYHQWGLINQKVNVIISWRGICLLFIECRVKFLGRPFSASETIVLTPLISSEIVASFWSLIDCWYRRRDRSLILSFGFNIPQRLVWVQPVVMLTCHSASLFAQFSIFPLVWVFCLFHWCTCLLLCQYRAVLFSFKELWKLDIFNSNPSNTVLFARDSFGNSGTSVLLFEF